MRVSSEIVDADYEALRLYALRKNRGLQVLFGILALFIGWTGWTFSPEGPVVVRFIDMIAALVHWVVIVVVFLVAAYVGGKVSRRKARITGSHVLALTDESIAEENAGGSTSFNWQYVDRLGETARHFFVFSVNSTAMMVPKRAFTSNAEIEQFRAEVLRRIGA